MGLCGFLPSFQPLTFVKGDKGAIDLTVPKQLEACKHFVQYYTEGPNIKRWVGIDCSMLVGNLGTEDVRETVTLTLTLTLTESGSMQHVAL